MEEILAVQVTLRRLPVLCSWPDNRHDGDLTVENAHLCWCGWSCAGDDSEAERWGEAHGAG